jgi:DNA invertase Pin-like site-specific DNA recombinase
MTGPLRVIGYVRVSTDKQEVGPEVQVDALVRAAGAEGWKLDIVKEDAVSAATVSKRPILLGCLQDLQKKGHDAIAVSKVDRLSRSVDDGSTLLTTSKRQGWAIICLDIGVDTSTIMGSAMFTMALTFGEMERRRIGERTKESMAKIKADTGKHMGRRTLLPPETLSLVLTLRQTMTYAQAAEHLNAQRIPTATGGLWHPSTVHQIVHRQ